MYRRTVTVILLGVVSCTSLVWAGEPNDYTIPGRAQLFEGTLSGVRQAYQTFHNGINDPNASDSRELRFLHAVAGTAMLGIRDDGGSIDSFLELAREFGIEVSGDQWRLLNITYPLNEHDAYEIPAGAPDANEVRTIIDTYMIPQIDALIADLDLIGDSAGDRFRIFLDPNETFVFFDPNALGLQYDLEVDYGEVFALKGFLAGLKGQLQAQAAYDLYVDPNDMLAEKVLNDCFNINTDLLGPYPDFLKVLPTANDPSNGVAVLAQARQDWIDAIDYYLDAIAYIGNEEDPQEDDLLYIDPNERRSLEITSDRLMTLRDSLVNDTVATYPWATRKTYSVQDSNSAPIGQLVLVFDFSGTEGNAGSLTFTDPNLSPSEWLVDELGIEDANRLWGDFEYHAGGQYRFGWFDATLSTDGNSFTAGSLGYYDLAWNWVSLQNVSGQLDNTFVADVNVDLNPVFGSSARYPTPVNPRDLLPEFDEWNSPLPGTMGHGLSDDPTLGGIVPDMNQYDWQVEMELQPAGLSIIRLGAAILDGNPSEWTAWRLVLDDVHGDTEKDPNATPGMDIDRLYMSYDATYLYGAITFYDQISSSINYMYELGLSYAPDDESASGAIRLTIAVSGGSATTASLYYMWQYMGSFDVVVGSHAIEFRILRANIPAPLAGRFISLESWGWNPSTSEWHDGEWNGTHLKIEGLGSNQLGTINGTITYGDYSGAPIFVQAYTDAWDPEGSVVASTMMTAPGPYTLQGIGIGWQGYVRAFTSLFEFNLFNPEGLIVEASVSATLTGPELNGVDLVLGHPTTLPEGTWVQGQFDPNTYDEDWYAFEAQQGDVYALDLTRGTSPYAYMALYGRDGHTELEEARYGGRWQHIDWTCPATGTYYVGVSHDNQPDSGTYELRVSQQDAMPSGYEIWAGNTNYVPEANWWERYYSIDKQNYIKLGESGDGQSGVFDGDYYTYYVIAVHEPVQVDSVRGIPDGYYSGALATGNTLNWPNIIGSPDDQYATIGGGYGGGTFSGFVVLTNPGNWNGLSVITSTSDTGSISGQVVDPNGSGLAGASVEIYVGDDENIADEDAWDYYGSTTTDPNGEYSFALLPQRRYRVRIPDQEVAGTHYFEGNLYNVQVLAGSETSGMDTTLRQAGLIYGYVKTTGGTPIPNAWVIAEASWTHEGNGWHNAWTDSNGRYELWLAPSPGDFYPVWVRQAFLNPSYESKWDGNFYQATLAGTQVPDYLLEPGGTVTGRVVNESGVGIEGVWLEVEWSEGGEDIGPYTETDANGDFALSGLVPGVNYICLDNGWREIQQDGVKYMVGETCTGAVNLSGGQTVDVGTFTVYEAGMVTGVVTDETGLPVVAASVELEGKDINGNWADREDVSTDAFGQFTVDYVAPGMYRLWCQKDGFVTGLETDIRVGRGEHVDRDVVIKSASEGATIRGTVTNYAAIAPYDLGGVMLPSYTNNDYDDYGYPDFGLIAVSMERDFTAEDLLNIDDLIVKFVDQDEIDDGYGDYFDTDPNETPGNYDMALPTGDIAIGLYTSPPGSLGEVNCVILHDWRRLNFSRGDVRDNEDFTATTGSTGTLNGNINVPVGYNDFPGDWCVIYAYALDPNGNVANSIPLGDAVAWSGWTTTYAFQNLPAGDYMLKAFAIDLASVVIPSVTVTSGQTTVQDITFTSGGTLAGQVTDGVAAVSGATVAIEENGKQATTDALGNYAIAGINAGTYTVNTSALGHAGAQAIVQVTEGSVTTQNFTLSATVGSISGTVKDIADANVNGATVIAYNETDNTSGTCETVGGAFSIAQLTPGQYILAVDTDDYGVVVYPEGANRITLSANQDITGVNIVVGTPQPPVFTVSSSASDTAPVVLSMEFYSDRDLVAVPTVSIVDGNGVLGGLTSNSALNRFEIDYTAHATDNIVRIGIQETTPLVPGSPASKIFTFEVAANLVATSSTNVTNATGGSASIMGTQDNTQIYVPPFAIAGAPGDSQALTLTIERYGDPGDPVDGTDANSVSAVYDFSFDESGVSIDQNHTFTITMSFQLPQGMTQQEFENSLVIQYFDAGDQQWKTDGISNVRVNWANSTIMFEVSHLSKFAAFLGDGLIGDFCGANFGPADGYVDVWDLMQFADHWHIRDGEGNWDAKFDLTGPNFGDADGYIDVWDLMTFADHWHEGVRP